MIHSLATQILKLRAQKATEDALQVNAQPPGCVGTLTFRDGCTWTFGVTDIEMGSPFTGRDARHKRRLTLTVTNPSMEKATATTVT